MTIGCAKVMVKFVGQNDSVLGSSPVPDGPQEDLGYSDSLLLWGDTSPGLCVAARH